MKDDDEDIAGAVTAAVSCAILTDTHCRPQSQHRK